MNIQRINSEVKRLKQSVLSLIENWVEPSLWEEFAVSQNLVGNQAYYILDHDLPIARDTKALLNILIAIEQITDRILEDEILMGVAFFKRFEIIQYVMVFYQNLQIYMSTNSILTHYLALFKESSFKHLSELMTEMALLCQYFTPENVTKAADLFITKMIVLEQYQENYQKSMKSPPTGIEIVKKNKNQDDFITTLVKKNDILFSKLFPEEKSERKPYYEITEKDSNTIRHSKLLLNGIVGLKKLFDDAEGYQQSKHIYSVGWAWEFIGDLRISYNFLQAFDYKAIIAEQANPFTDKIKSSLKQLDVITEKIICIVDRFESEFHLKPNILLHFFEGLLSKFHIITTELKIPIDYVKQKNLYYQSRKKAREAYLIEIDDQIKELQKIIAYQYHAIVSIPYDVILEIQTYIKKYEDDLSMNHDNLNIYKQYLANALDLPRGLKAFVFSQIEYIINLSGLTIHSEFMTALNHRVLYLKNQSIFLQRRFQQEEDKLQLCPFYYFKIADLVESGSHAVIGAVLKKYASELLSQKNALLASTKSEPITEKQNEKSPEKLQPPMRIKKRLGNQIQLKTNEHQFFSTILKKFDDKESFLPTMDEIKNTSELTPGSAILLDEIAEIMRNTKSI